MIKTRLLRLLGSYFHIGMNGMKACDKIFAFLDLPEPEEGTKTIADGETDIRIGNLSYAYNSDQPVLKDISMEISRGSFVSLVGASGSGKSTLADILMKQHPGFSGNITIGDIPLQDM